TLLLELSKLTKPGTYYSKVQVPVELNKFQHAMLAIGNLGRNDPNYRKKNGAKTALDFSGDSVLTEMDGKMVAQKIYKNNSKPPYFKALVLNPALSKAAQFQAEYQASTNAVSHFGPKNFNGADMYEFFKRAKHFGYTFDMEGEGGGGGGPSDFP